MRRRLFLFLLVLFAVIGPVWPVTTSAHELPLLELENSWRYRWGDSPTDDQGRLLWLHEPIGAPGWVDRETHSAQASQQPHSILWARAEIPAEHWQNPVIYLPQVIAAFEIYADTTLIFKSAEFEPANELKFASIQARLLSLPVRTSATVLSCRVYSPLPGLIGINDRHQSSLAGEYDAVMKRLVQRGADRVVLGSLFFFAGIISLAIFLRRFHYRIWYLLSFAWLACNIGLFYVLSTSTVKILGVPPAFTYYVGLVSFAAFPVGMYSFLEQILGEHKVLRRLWQLHVAYVILAVPLDVLNILIIPETQIYYSTAFAVSIVIGLVIIMRRMPGANKRVRSFGIGFGFFALTGLHDVLAGMEAIPLVHWLSHWGMLVMILFLADILERSYSKSLRQLALYAKELEEQSSELEQYSVTLEQRVENRTRDLELKNEQLVDTMEELQDTQQRMIVQDKMASLGNLVAGVAHEMNTPMGALLGAADVEARCIERIESSVDTSDDIGELRTSSRFERAMKLLRESNRIINTGGKRIITIMASLKSFARLDEAAFQMVDLHEALDNTLILAHHELKNRITVVKNYGELPSVGCNANQINQVFMNLVVNAAQSIEGEGTITIDTAARDNEVTVRIADTGKGIAAADLKRIFDPGFTTKGVGIGTGLGLSICYKIMEVHKGEILVESEPGRGAAFIMKMPAI